MNLKVKETILYPIFSQVIFLRGISQAHTKWKNNTNLGLKMYTLINGITQNKTTIPGIYPGIPLLVSEINKRLLLSDLERRTWRLSSRPQTRSCRKNDGLDDAWRYDVA